MAGKKTGKRLLTWVLVLVMALSLLPLNALAANLPETDSSSGMIFTKQLVSDEPDNAGNYTIQMTAQATGKEVETTKTVPMDIALVLDVSGSMDEYIPARFEKVENVDKSKTYYVQYPYEFLFWKWTRYREVEWCDGCQAFVRKSLCIDAGPFGHYNLGKEFHENEDTFYTKIDEVQKLAALKTAVNGFIDQVAKKSADSSIAVVSFASEAANVSGGLLPVKTDAEMLKAAVNGLNAYGATRADLGMQEAARILDNGINSKKVVVMFTDGEPTSGNKFEKDVANATISAAKGMKDKGTEVFTVGVFDSDPDDKTHAYMNYVSSNYPQAQNMRNPGDGSDNGYYTTADSADSLSKVFEGISQTITKPAPVNDKLDEKTVITDTLSDYFTFAGTEEDVKVYAKKGNEETDITGQVKITPDPQAKTVTVTGYDFSKYYVGSDDAETLVIKIKVKPSGKGCASASIPTNEGNATVTLDDKEIDNATPPTVGGYSVEYVIDSATSSDASNGASWPNNGNGPATLYYPQGAAVPVTDSKPTLEGHEFTGWKSDINGDNNVYTSDGANSSFTMPAANVVLTAQWTANKYTVTYALTDNVKPSNYSEPTDNKEYTKDEEYTVDSTHKEGDKVVENGYTYTFSGWKLNGAGNVLTGNQTMGDGNVVLKGTWTKTANTDTKYTVNHYQQNLNDNDYTLFETESDKTGTTGEQTNATAKNYEGFTAKQFEQQTIAADGKTVVDIYYDRNTYSVTYTDGVNNETIFENEVHQNVKYGAPVPAYNNGTDPSRKNYTFAGWDSTVPKTMPANNLTFTAQWQLTELPTYPVYVYAFFAHDDAKLTGNLTVNRKQIEWNENSANGQYFVTLGVYKNGTTKEPTDGATGLVLKDLNVTKYETATSHGNGTKNGVTLNDITGFPYPYGKVCSGAAGYPESDGKLSWHLDGQVNVYTVTYNNNMPESAPTTSDGYYFGSYTIAAAPKRDGYTFTGWKDGNTTYEADQEIEKLSKDLNLIAQWTKNTIPTYTFDLSNLDTIKVNKEFKSMYGLSATRSFTATATIEKETYTAEVDPNSPSNRSAATAEPTYIGKATGTVTLKTGKTTKAFDFGKESKFQLEPGDYRITVEETKGTDRYVNYDTKPYTRYFNVREDGVISAIDSITITNEYTKRHTAAAPSKPTLNTGDHYAYVMGYPDGTVRPNGSITRAEVSAILFRLLSDKTRDEYFTTESSFTDVKAGAWYNNSIATLEKAGVIVDTAKGGAFRPNEAITRAELAAMLAQFSDAKPVKGVKFSDVSAEHWAYEAIAIAAKMGWIEGYPDGTFRPDATITRAEMMTLVNRALERVPSDEDHLLSKRVMLTFPDCKSGDWFYIAVQEATNSHTYERAATEKNGDEQWTALRANRDWTQLEK